MRLHGVTLRNFRGVGERSVEFADSGITVVEGDNGTGKTSLMQAVDLIFRYPHDSRSQAIRDIQPEGKDIGAEIELTATLGPYRLTYEKHYHRGRSTRLEVHEPVHELLTGRDAHDRAEEIFNANVDVHLFRALWLQQGVELGQADLSAQTSLGAALDQQAAEPVNNESETTLFQRVREEYERYFTAGTGQQKIDYRRVVEDHESAKAKVEDLEAQLATLEETVDQVASLSERISGLQEDQSEQAQRVSSLEMKWQEIERREQQVEGLRLKAEIAAGNCERARSDLNARNRLTEAVVTAKRKRDEVSGKLELLSPGLSAAQESFDAARQARDQARVRFDESQKILRLCQADCEHRRNELDTQLMSERRKRAEEAHAELREAESFLATCRIDGEKLAEIEDAHATALTARARFEGESAHVDIEALCSQEMLIDGKSHKLSPAERVSRSVERGLTVELLDVLRIEITGGHGSESLADAAHRAERDLSNKLAEVGATDISDARAIDRQRIDAEATRERSRKVLDNDLRDLSLEQLTDRIEGLIEKTGRYISGRTSTEPLPDNFDAAEAARKTATDDAESAQTAHERAVRDFESAEKALNEARQEETELGVQLRVAEGGLEGAQETLDDARATESDDSIAARVHELDSVAKGASDAHREAASELEKSNPAAVRAELETARQVEGRIDKQVADLEDQLGEARAFLSIKGEAGLHDELDEARTRLEHATRRRVAEEARAHAARKLFETMSRHRDDARRRYLAPFREKIESFGRIVFGPEFSAELDDDLRIERANVTGVSLRFDQHSTGEREQLGMIARLACASIVSENGGVPLILDDALGWTDSGRLKSIGASLTVGSRGCQVIALTCIPGRYQHVGAEKVVTMV